MSTKIKNDKENDDSKYKAKKVNINSLQRDTIRSNTKTTRTKTYAPIIAIEA